MQEQILTLSDALLDAREAKYHADEALKGIKASIEEIEAQLIELMMDDELTSFKRNGVNFCLVTKNHISADPERKDELWEAMKKKGYGHMFSINTNTLAGEVKRLMEDNEGQVPEWLIGLIKNYEKPGIQVRKK